MRKIIVTEFVSLDGVIADPQKWLFEYWNAEIQEFKVEETKATGAMLLGRITYEAFAQAWPSRKDDAFADMMNNMPKLVVSTTLKNAAWNNSTLIKSNVSEEIARLKKQPGGDIVVHGSQTLVQFLMKEGLIDEYHLLVFPLVLGSGIRCFAEGTQTKLMLVESKTYDTGVVLLVYRRHQ